MSHNIASFGEQDPGMNSAIEQARRTLPAFLKAFVAPTPKQTAFLLKVRFEHEGKAEHIWVADIDASAAPLKGTVANEPRIQGLTFMQRVEFNPSQISDWMYTEDGYLVGGYTTRLIRSRMTSIERAAHDANVPYKFRD